MLIARRDTRVTAVARPCTGIAGVTLALGYARCLTVPRSGSMGDACSQRRRAHNEGDNMQTMHWAARPGGRLAWRLAALCGAIAVAACGGGSDGVTADTQAAMATAPTESATAAHDAS